MRQALVAVCLTLVAFAGSGCATLDYDLSSIDIPISAKPADPSEGTIEPFRLEARNTLWVHGLFGRSVPDVTAMLAEVSEGYDSIAGLRVRQVTSIHHWLTTHLSLSLVRMKGVVIEGELVRRMP